MKPFTSPFPLGNGNLLQAVTMFGSSVGFYAFGYDQGVANALTQNAHFQKKFPELFASPAKQGATLGVFVLGAWIGCLSVSFIGNKLGRRTILQIASCFTFVFGALQAGAVNLPMFIIVRFLNGIFVGSLTSTVPPYIAELAAPKYRGLLMSLELVAASLGLMTAFIVTFAFQDIHGEVGWRVPLAIQSALILVTSFALFFSPESPRYLCEVGQVDAGKQVLASLHGPEYAETATQEILSAIALEHSVARTGWLACFENNSQRFRYRTFLAMGTNFLQQATGINMATYYAGNIFSTLKLTPRQGGLMIVGLGIGGFVGVLITSVGLIDRLGRIKTMILGSLLCSIGQIMLAAGAANVEKKAGAIAAATGLFLFLIAFSGSWLPLGFMYPAEVTPLAIRTKASPFGQSVQYIMNFFVVMVTPVGIKQIGYKFYIPFALSSFFMIPIIWIFFPEVGNLSLEEIDELFAGDRVIMRRSVNERVGHTALDGVADLEKQEAQHVESVKH
ncbi:general substrate transporter [Meredithblackwellia eburnea MCA 4105]